MNTTEKTREYVGHCIVGCGWTETDSDHPPYCERTVGSRAEAVTEPGWARTQFWCSVIHPFHNGMLTPSQVSELDKHYDGVRLQASISDESSSGWRAIDFNFSAAEARQLAAQLVAAADSHDGIDRSHHLMRRIEKLAQKIGADVYGP